MESSQDLSTQILNNPAISQQLLAELVPITYQELGATAWGGRQGAEDPRTGLK